MQNNPFHTPTACCVSFCFIPTLESNQVAGLFGLPSNDAYAVVQTQNALNGETDGEDLHINILDFAVFEHVSPLRG